MVGSETAVAVSIRGSVNITDSSEAPDTTSQGYALMESINRKGRMLRLRLYRPIY